METITIRLNVELPAEPVHKQYLEEQVVAAFQRHGVVATVERVPEPYARGSMIERKLVCPYCQHNGSEENGGYFEHVEDALVWRRLEVEEGILRASGTTEVDYESTCNPRVFCPKCTKYFALPKGATVIWE